MSHFRKHSTLYRAPWAKWVAVIPIICFWDISLHGIVYFQIGKVSSNTQNATNIISRVSRRGAEIQKQSGRQFWKNENFVLCFFRLAPASQPEWWKPGNGECQPVPEPAWIRQAHVPGWHSFSSKPRPRVMSHALLQGGFWDRRNYQTTRVHDDVLDWL